MQCPDCGAKVLNVKAGYACGICGTLNADGHTLWTFLDTLTEEEDSSFWQLACQNDTMPFYGFLSHMAHIVGRFGVNPREFGTCHWEQYERQWEDSFPDKVRHQ